MKTRITFLSLVVLIFITGITWGQSTIIKPGDVNKDNEVNIIDAMKVAQYVANISKDIDWSVADVDGSNTIDILDALLIARYSAGLVPNLIRPITIFGYPGMAMIISGISFDPTGNEVRFKDTKSSIVYYSSDKVDSTDGLRVIYTIPTYMHPYCYYDPMPCAAPDQPVKVAAYSISVITSKGESYPVPFYISE